MAANLSHLKYVFRENNLEYLCDGKRHLICIPYTVENLHIMAADLNIGRWWFHAGDKPHYDIPKRRIAEITAKCRVVSSREILSIIQEGVKKD